MPQFIDAQGWLPMADYDQLASDWRTSGGDVIRKEFQDAINNARA